MQANGQAMLSIAEVTPFDELVVKILSPDSNQDRDSIDTIAVVISSSSESLGQVKLTETGPNTGLFEESFKLTPNKAMFPGDLTAIREDGITVEFRIDKRTVVSQSIFVTYHVGNIMFDKDQYSFGERAVLRVIDPDASFNPDTIDTIQVRIWSTTDRGGLLVHLRETGDRTGIFEEIVTFTKDEESTGTRLRVSDGDTLTAKYTDRTLPPPAALDADKVFTVEVEELFAASTITIGVASMLERVEISEPEIIDQMGTALSQISTGIQVLVQSKITNPQTEKQPFVYIVKVKDKNSITVSLSWIAGELPANDSIKASQSWTPDAAEEYILEVFLWESLQKPIVLAQVKTKTLQVM
ncbi:MAG: hypothetical protein ACE5KA_08965 [Nitrososphaerales archaeon]